MIKLALEEYCSLSPVSLQGRSQVSFFVFFLHVFCDRLPERLNKLKFKALEGRRAQYFVEKKKNVNTDYVLEMLCQEINSTGQRRPVLRYSLGAGTHHCMYLSVHLSSLWPKYWVAVITIFHDHFALLIFYY